MNERRTTGIIELLERLTERAVHTWQELSGDPAGIPGPAPLGPGSPADADPQVEHAA